MCDFCNNIFDMKEFLKIDENDRPIISLVHDSDNHEYVLWNECDDYFYSGIVLQGIRYCPRCGRKLNEG